MVLVNLSVLNKVILDVKKPGLIINCLKQLNPVCDTTTFHNQGRTQRTFCYSQVEIFPYSASTLLFLSLFGATPFGLDAKLRPTCGSVLTAIGPLFALRRYNCTEKISTRLYRMLWHGGDHWTTHYS
jgi:hypothetical protein